MRKDKLSSYQAKKTKLKKIKDIILNYDREMTEAYIDELYIPKIGSEETIRKIWEIVEDED